PIKLDVRYGEFYASNWTKHKNLCKKIKEAKKKKKEVRNQFLPESDELADLSPQAANTEPKEPEDKNACLDMEVDSDSRSKIEPDVIIEDAPRVQETSTPQAADTEPKEPKDKNACLDMDIDSDSQSKTEPGVIIENQDTSTPRAASAQATDALPIVTSRSINLLVRQML
ncbi:hypothetical protein C0993_012447, partial [Termitomyces sp. T159_Od127]